ncbi:MAG TPA: polysaccharide biosynthesis protein [Ornithinibacillus sp.]|nr:polysaccharide biosynthesis protein [Ornithinibacillus sp.]
MESYFKVIEGNDVVLKKLSLKKNIAWTLAGSIIYSVTQWLLLIVIAKLGTPEMVGQYALGLAITAPVVMLTDMKLRLSLVTDAKTSFQFEHYLGTRIFSTIISLIIFILIVLLFGYEFHTSMIIILIGLAKLPEAVSDIFHGLLQKHERMDFCTISNIIKGVLTVIVFAIILYSTQDLILAIIGQLLVWTLILLFYDGRIAKQYTAIKISFHLPKIKELTKLTIPLGFMGLLTSFNTNIPSYFIEHFLGKEELGYFVALYYILLAGNRVANSLKQPAAPRLAVLYQIEDKSGYKKLLIILIGLGLLMGLGVLFIAYVFGDILLTLIYTPSYAAYTGLFIALMIAGIFNYPSTFLSTAIIATRHFKSQPYLAALWVFVSVIGCIIFIPLFGVIGAALAVILSSFIEAFSLLIVLISIVKKDKPELGNKRKESTLLEEVSY